MNNPLLSSKEIERMSTIISILEKHYPNVTIQLNFYTTHQLLVATILSSQCTDERVNQVTKILFKKYRHPEDYLKVPTEELERDIFSTGYYKAKTKHIREATSLILNKYDGKVPDNMDELLTLPGVGRKTANVILGHCYNIPGIVVDTHVLRLSNRLGFVNSRNAEKVEFQLNQLVPIEKWVQFTHLLINHGRKICTARNPKCQICPTVKYCPSADTVNQK